jgi:branched-chain amino acid transport system permease protein
MGVVNFAHGELYALGAYIGLSVQLATGNFLLAMAAAVIGLAVVGLLMEVTIIRPLYDRDPLYQIPVTFGAIIVLTELMRLIWGGSVQSFPIPDIVSGTVTFLSIDFSIYRTFILLLGGLFILLLWVFLRTTRYGIIIRAAIADTEAVESMGYNKSRIYSFLFALGAVYAAIAGVLISPLFGVSPGMGSEIIITVFIIVIVGGLGSFKGTIVSGMLIGIMLAFGRIYVPTVSEAIPFLLMAGVLLYRPRGLFGIEGVFH